MVVLLLSKQFQPSQHKKNTNICDDHNNWESSSIPMCVLMECSQRCYKSETQDGGKLYTKMSKTLCLCSLWQQSSSNHIQGHLFKLVTGGFKNKRVALTVSNTVPLPLPPPHPGSVCENTHTHTGTYRSTQNVNKVCMQTKVRIWKVAGDDGEIEDWLCKYMCLYIW